LHVPRRGTLHAARRAVLHLFMRPAGAYFIPEGETALPARRFYGIMVSEKSVENQIGGFPVKFIHIADLHLGKSMFDYPLLQDQKAVLEQVIGYAAQYEVDAVVAAGDLYDKPVPPAEAVT